MALVCFRTRSAAGNEGNAQIGFEQGDQIAFRSQRVALIDVEIMAANQRHSLLEVFAISTSQPALLSQLINVDVGMRCKRVLGVEHQLEFLGEKSPAIEAFPSLTELGGNGKLGLT